MEKVDAIRTASSHTDEETDPEQQEVNQQLWVELETHVRNEAARSEAIKKSREWAENVAKTRLQQLRDHGSGTQSADTRDVQDRSANTVHCNRKLTDHKQQHTQREKGSSEGSLDESVQIGTQSKKKRRRRAATTKNSTHKSP